MIDNPKQTARLLTKFLMHLPIEARLDPRLVDHFRKEFPQRRFPERWAITDVHYGGDEGGILCRLDDALSDEDQRLYVSLTHLEFDRRSPLAREIFAYQKHRRKRLRIFDAYDACGLDVEPVRPARDEAA